MDREQGRNDQDLKTKYKRYFGVDLTEEKSPKESCAQKPKPQGTREYSWYRKDTETLWNRTDIEDTRKDVEERKRSTEVRETAVKEKPPIVRETAVQEKPSIVRETVVKEEPPEVREIVVREEPPEVREMRPPVSGWRRKGLVLAILLLVFLMAAFSFAWYYLNTLRKVDTPQQEIMLPYYLYLVDASSQSSTQLSVGNLHPGETKGLVLGVSNENPDGGNVSPAGRDSSFAYELEMAYTCNLPLDYRVYQLIRVAGDGPGTVVVQGEDGKLYYFHKEEVRLAKNSAVSQSVTEENNNEMYNGGENLTEEQVESLVNYVQYDVYDTDTRGTALSLATGPDGSGGVQYELDYYYVEFLWKETESGFNFDDYLKETDLVYVVVKALQPKPVKSGS